MTTKVTCDHLFFAFEPKLQPVPFLFRAAGQGMTRMVACVAWGGD